MYRVMYGIPQINENESRLKTVDAKNISPEVSPVVSTDIITN